LSGRCQGKKKNCLEKIILASDLDDPNFL
jgi:hypothetical protein